MDRASVKQEAVCSVSRARSADDQLKPFGKFLVEHWRDGKRIATYEFSNTITNQGKNKLLDVMFHGVTAIATWYLGLIDGSGTPTLDVGDTYATHGGWTEFTDYSETARLEWTEGASAGQTVTNAAPVVFDITESGSVYGLFLVGGGSTPTLKSDVAGGGTLWAGAPFASGTRPVGIGDQLKVTYSTGA